MNRSCRRWTLLAAIALAGLSQARNSVAAAGAAAPGTGRASDCVPIGTARLAPGGTIVLRLLAVGPGGATGEGLLRYPPSARDHAAVAAHVGPIRPGEVVPVCPWPDQPEHGAAAAGTHARGR